MATMYDMMLIFPASLQEEDLDAALARVGEELTRLGGEVLGTDKKGERTFARPMKKRDSGFYVILRCSMDPATVAALHGRLKLVEQIFRVQIVKASAEPAAVETEEAEAGEAPAADVAEAAEEVKTDG